jgi:mono/diheme cytochrome c family protein
MTSLPSLLRASLTCAGVLLAGWPAAASEVDKGRQLAEALCARCHMAAGQGEKQGASGVPGFRAVANRAGYTQADIVAWLRSVPPMMPNHHLTQDETTALAAFIMSLRERR